MSSALRKKIESNTGMPPSLLGLRSFWEQLEAQIGQWVLETFDAEVKATIFERNVMTNRVTVDFLEESTAFPFPDDIAPGLCAIVMDRSCVVKYAARRLNETPESFAEASNVFLSLICEEPASLLRNRLVSKVLGRGVHDDDRVSDDIFAITGGLRAPNRYLKVGFDIPVDEQTLKVHLVFHLGFLLDFVREFFDRAASAKAENCAQSHSTLLKSVHNSVLSVEAIIDRLSLSIGECSRLHVGQVIPLPSAELGALSVATETIEGPLDIAVAEMGVWKTQRAIKLNAPVSGNFVRNLAGY